MKTVIGTTTYSQTLDLRARLAIETVKRARQFGLPVVVVDGGSCVDLRLSLKGEGAVLRNEKIRGMGSSRRQCIAEAWKFASPDGAVLWMEPEKWPLISQVGFIEGMMMATNADIIVPARKSLKSYPPLQALAEQLGNMYFAKATGHKLDVWIGPRLIGPRAIPHFLNYAGGVRRQMGQHFCPNSPSHQGRAQSCQLRRWLRASSRTNDRRRKRSVLRLATPEPVDKPGADILCRNEPRTLQ